MADPETQQLQEEGEIRLAENSEERVFLLGAMPRISLETRQRLRAAGIVPYDVLAHEDGSQTLVFQRTQVGWSEADRSEHFQMLAGVVAGMEGAIIIDPVIHTAADSERSLFHKD